MADSRGVLRRSVPLVALAVAVASAFIRTMGYGLYFDDHHHARPWTLRQVLSTFHGPFDPLRIEPNYFRPLPVVTFAMDWILWGYTAWGYHVTNLVLHIAATLLLFVFLERAVHSRPAAFIGALAFALIPSNAATVIYVSERSDAMVFIFVLVGLLSLHRFRRDHRARWIFLLDTAFVFALLSKEIGLAMPLITGFWWLTMRLDQDVGPSPDADHSSTSAYWRRELGRYRAATLNNAGLRDWLVVLGPMALITVAYLLFRSLVLPPNSLSSRFGESGNPISGMAHGVYNTLNGVPWEVSGRTLPALVAALVLAFVIRPRSQMWRVVVFGLLTIAGACLPLSFSGGVEPRLLYVAEFGVALVIAAIVAMFIEAVRTKADGETRVGKTATAAVAGLLAILYLAGTAVTLVRAQDEFKPGSAKVLAAEHDIWINAAQRPLYPARYITEIRDDLIRAGLIDSTAS